MDKKIDRSFLNEIDLPQPSPEALRGRQSVRATFKLSPRAIGALNIVAVHLGIKQKSLFDHLIEDVETLSTIAKEIETEHFRELSRIQKTFVISRRTLLCLDEISRQFDTPRDALVEYSIQRLLPVIGREREKHRKRKRLLTDISQHLEEGLKLVAKARSLLGEDDPVALRLADSIEIYSRTQSDIEYFVEKGNIIEEF